MFLWILILRLNQPFTMLRKLVACGNLVLSEDGDDGTLTFQWK